MRRSRFEVYKREDDQWDWRLIAANGRIVGTSGGQGYRTEYEAERALDSVCFVFFDARSRRFDERVRQTGVWS